MRRQHDKSGSFPGSLPAAAVLLVMMLAGPLAAYAVDPVTGFTVEQLKSGNLPSTDGTTRFWFHWDARTDGATVEVYYKKFGNYPEFSDPPAGTTLAKFDFKPSSAPTPAGWTEDHGAFYSPVNGFGWDADRTASTKVRNLIPSDPNDTFLRKKNEGTAAIWMYRVPAPGTYSVKVIVGDAFTSCRNMVRVEGNVFFDNLYLTGAHFADATQTVTTADNLIQVEIGYPGALVPPLSETKLTAVIISNPSTGSPGSAPTIPVTYGQPDWTLASTITTSGQELDLPDRDFYYFVAYAKLAATPSTPVMVGGVLNYHLGDFANGIADCAGNNDVFDEDFSLFGANYGRALAAGDLLSCLDIAPTHDGTVDGRPVPDNVVDFKDLVIFAQNYDNVGKPAELPAVSATDVLSLETGEAADRIEARVTAQGSGRVQGMSVHLEWNPDVVEPVASRGGELLARQSGVALSGVPGNVDIALRGRRATGLGGEGVLATVEFRRIAPGDAGIHIAAVQALDNQSRPVEVAIAGQARPQVAAPPRSVVLGNVPNPFNPATLISFSLAASGPMELGVYSLSGRLVKTLERGTREAGVHAMRWDGTDERGMPVASGLYMVRLRAAGASSARSIVLLK